SYKVRNKERKKPTTEQNCVEPAIRRSKSAKCHFKISKNRRLGLGAIDRLTRW
ncbi:hypothetical protein HAX54_051617, partial [Datura stramonium]|nr:hypothetical protein [Datura stramonium]